MYIFIIKIHKQSFFTTDIVCRYWNLIKRVVRRNYGWGLLIFKLLISASLVYLRDEIRVRNTIANVDGSRYFEVATHKQEPVLYFYVCKIVTNKKSFDGEFISVQSEIGIII